MTSLDRLQKQGKSSESWKVVMNLEITDIRIKKVSADSRMKAVVSITFDNAFVVHDIKIIEGSGKLFTAMPSRRTPEGEYKDIAHPINSETRQMIENAIITAYKDEPDYPYGDLSARGKTF